MKFPADSPSFRLSSALPPDGHRALRAPSEREPTIVGVAHMGNQPVPPLGSAESASLELDEDLCAPCVEQEDVLDDGVATFECRICLSQMPASDHVPLTSCAHAYCCECLGAFVDTKIRQCAGTNPTTGVLARAVVGLRCPTCAIPLGRASLVALRTMLTSSGRERDATMVPPLLIRALEEPSTAEVEEAAATARAADEAPGGGRGQRGSPPAPDPAAERALRAWMCAQHVKLCPNRLCAAPIEKNGDCDNMRCRSCQCAFTWSSVPLAAPCRGYHCCKAWPYVLRCKHFQSRSQLPLRRRVELATLQGAAALPLMPVAAPVIALAAPLLALDIAVKRVCKEWRQRQLARARERAALRMRERTNEFVAAYVSCRTTGEHQWVAGWCCRCGALELVSTSALDAEVGTGSA